MGERTPASYEELIGAAIIGRVSHLAAKGMAPLGATPYVSGVCAAQNEQP